MMHLIRPSHASASPAHARRRLAAVGLGVAVALAVGACSRYLTAGAAVVNGVSIAQAEMDQRIESLLGPPQPGDEEQRAERARDILRDLVEEELIRQETERRGIAVDLDDVEERIGLIRDRFPSPEQFDEALEREGLTMTVLRERLALVMARERLGLELAEEDPVTGEQVRAYYDANPAQFEEVRVRMILLRTLDPQDPEEDQEVFGRAQAAIEEIEEGADFADVARRLSEDPSTRDDGGDLGFQPLRALTPELAGAAAGLPTGEVSDPIRTALGYSVITVEDRRPSPFEAVAEEIREQLSFQRAEEAIARWFRDAVARARIVINPRYGQWDPDTGRVVPFRAFERGTPEDDLPPGFPPGLDPPSGP